MQDTTDKTRRGPQGNGSPTPELRRPARAELIWEGKYDNEGKAHRPIARSCSGTSALSLHILGHPLALCYDSTNHDSDRNVRFCEYKMRAL